MADQTSYCTQNFQDGIVLTAEHLNHMEQGIADVVNNTVRHTPMELSGAQATQTRNNIGLALTDTIQNNELTEIWAALADLQSKAGYPTFNTGSMWTSGASLDISTITAVHFVQSYSGSFSKVWNADAEKTGSIKGYLNGTEVYISGEGSSRIRLNSNCMNMFANFTALTTVTGLDVLDGSEVTNFATAFYMCSALQRVDLSPLFMPKIESIAAMFTGDSQLVEVKFPKYGFPLSESVATNFPGYTIPSEVFEGCDKLKTVDFGRGVTHIWADAFKNHIALEKVSGLNGVTSIGDKAFTYTPNLTDVDLVAENIQTVGVDAFRLSGVEDCADLSDVPLESVGLLATRHKRWSADELAAIRAVEIPDVYIEVPNHVNQDVYDDIQFGTLNGQPVYIAGTGCSAVALYHEWNAVYNGKRKGERTVYTKEAGGFEAWWNDTINRIQDDGTRFEDKNDGMNNSIMEEMVGLLNWTYQGQVRVTSAEQLQTIVDRLNAGLPTYAVMSSANYIGRQHSVLVIGGNSETGKLAILDSHVMGETGIVAWVAFEDIFDGTDDGNDYLMPIDYDAAVNE